MEGRDQKFLDETRELWSRRVGRPISQDEAVSIVANIAGFFQVLSDWDRATRNAGRDEEASSGPNMDNKGDSNV